MSDGKLSRRQLLLGAPALALAACDASRPSRGFLGAMEKWNQRFQMWTFDPERLAEPPSGENTAEGQFPVYHIGKEIPVAPADWMLKVGGAVARPKLYSLDELKALPRTDIRVRHYCVEGWSAVAAWHGVRVRDLADAVGADPRAGFVEFRSFDEGYWSSWDRPSALHPQTLLAYGMNNAPLRPDHGAPLRVYASVKLGYKLVKYLTEVNFLPQPTGGYWENQGYEWFAGV